MTMVIAIFLNILIAQLSDTYSEAKKTAKLQYAIDTMIIVTRLEYSRLSKWVRSTVLSQNGGSTYCHEGKTELLNHPKHKEQSYLSIITFPCLFNFFENNIQSLI